METFSALLAICAGTSPVTGELPTQRPVMGALMCSLICTRINSWVNNREAGHLRRHRAHYDVIVMVKSKNDFISDWVSDIIRIWYQHYASCTILKMLPFGSPSKTITFSEVSVSDQTWLNVCEAVISKETVIFVYDRKHSTVHRNMFICLPPSVYPNLSLVEILNQWFCLWNDDPRKNDYKLKIISLIYLRLIFI